MSELCRSTHCYPDDNILQAVHRSLDLVPPRPPHLGLLLSYSERFQGWRTNRAILTAIATHLISAASFTHTTHITAHPRCLGRLAYRLCLAVLRAASNALLLQLLLHPHYLQSAAIRYIYSLSHKITVKLISASPDGHMAAPHLDLGSSHELAAHPHPSSAHGAAPGRPQGTSRHCQANPGVHRYR